MMMVVRVQEMIITQSHCTKQFDSMIQRSASDIQVQIMGLILIEHTRASSGMAIGKSVWPYNCYSRGSGIILLNNPKPFRTSVGHRSQLIDPGNRACSCTARCQWIYIYICVTLSSFDTLSFMFHYINMSVQLLAYW